MENIAVSLIVKGEFRNVEIPIEMVGELSKRLRKEGICLVHTNKETVACEGFVILAKGIKNQVMVFSSKD